MNELPQTTSTYSSRAEAPAHNATGSAVPFILCFLVLIGMAYGGWKWWEVAEFQARKENAIPPNTIGPPLTEFELTERSGKPFRSVDMRGRVWVVSYFFTTCPGQCLRLNANIQVLEKTPELKDVTWVSITCDPDNDTLEALRAYADRWQADPERWLFCRADLEYIQRVALGMKVDQLSLRGHKDYAVVIDKSGNIRGMFDATSEIQCVRMKKLLAECLAEEPPSEQPPADPAADEAAKEKSS
jgi:cytochrome oxidase Cu insertion factor (SCO1/SenC/PrrC family)